VLAVSFHEAAHLRLIKAAQNSAAGHLKIWLHKEEGN
jgi:hypothetical protein